MANAARHLRGGGASANGNDFPISDQTGRHQADLAFFWGALLLLLLERREMSKRFIEHRGNGYGAAVIAAQ